MIVRAQPTLKRAQRGAALMLLAVMLVLGGTWLIVSVLNSAKRDSGATRTANGEVLRQAKAGLLGYIAISADTDNSPGRLPCPEPAVPTTEGVAASTCTAPAIGRLPWRTLGLDKLIDSSGEPLWYVVSPGFANTGSPLVINSNTPAQLALDGTSNAVVALIIAPGAPINVQSASGCSAWNQTRGQTFPLNFKDYLECDNATYPADSSFASIGPSNNFNDQVISITPQDLFSILEPIVGTRIERDIKPSLVTYFSEWTNAFPYPATFASPDPGTLASRPQNQYLGTTTVLNEGGGNGRGLLPVTGSQSYTWTNGAGSVTLQGGIAGSISGISCGTTSWPFDGWRCSFDINSINLGWNSSNWSQCTNPSDGTQYRYCMVDPIFSVVGRVGSNAGRSLAKLPNANEVTVTSSGGTNRSVTASSIAGTLSSAGVGTVNFRSTHTYSRYRTSSFSRSMVVTIPDLSISPVTSSTDPIAGWFVNNEWYRLVYYAVAPGFLPGASANCTSTPCLTVSNLPPHSITPSTNNRAILILSGRALNGSSRPSSVLANYLEGENASPSDYIFENSSSTGATINDRVIILGP